MLSDSTLSDRFWSKVNKTPTCWLWTGGKISSGYGQLTADGSRKLAHRFAYEDKVGPIPPGLELDHLCRVPLCVNPAHLEPVTHRENGLRGTSPAALNARKTHCDSGHELVGENLYITSTGSRYCRACHRASETRRKLRLRANAQPRTPKPYVCKRGHDASRVVVRTRIKNGRVAQYRSCNECAREHMARQRTIA